MRTHTNRRRATQLLASLLLTGTAALRPAAAAAPTDVDPFGSMQWPELRRAFLPGGRVVFDPRVQVQVPAFAEDPLRVPVSVSADALDGVESIVVFVDRNPIKKVLEYFPLGALPRVSFRFKLEQASPVRAAARTRDGVWHVGGARVDSSGGGCTAAGAARLDPAWSSTLGVVDGRVFPHSVAPGSSDGASRLRLRVMHPMDTGLVGGIPAFYVNRLALRDAGGRELMRLNAFEPISENPVFSFDFARPPQGRLQLVGTDTNGNRIAGTIE